MMRRILTERGHKRRNLGTAAAMAFLNVTDPRSIRLLRKGLAEWGFRGINLAHGLAARLGLLGRAGSLPAATTGRPKVRTQVIELVRRPLRVDLPRQTTRAMLGLEDRDTVPVVRDPARVTDDSDAVFYFPGCGSERLFSDLSLAAIAMLYETGAQVVLPPGYLCCGFPQTAAGQNARGHRISMQNRVLFHRVANTLNYMDIRTVIVSCGTCMDQLLEYEFEKIFPGCRLLDVHEYLLEKGVRLNGATGLQYLYHDPCHSPMKTYSPPAVASRLLGSEVLLSERCCGEAGTLGTARPDIATQLRFRKEEELRRGIQTLSGHDRAQRGRVKLLTACPACQQGLSRYAEDTGLETDYIVVEMARTLLGEGWQDRFVARATNGGIERVLL